MNRTHSTSEKELRDYAKLLSAMGNMTATLGEDLAARFAVCASQICAFMEEARAFHVGQAVCYDANAVFRPEHRLIASDFAALDTQLKNRIGETELPKALFMRVNGWEFKSAGDVVGKLQRLYRIVWDITINPYAVEWDNKAVEREAQARKLASGSPHQARVTARRSPKTSSVDLAA